MQKIVKKIERYNIPYELVINADQTPLKYIPVGHSTLASKNSKNIPLAGVGGKRAITATFSQTLDDSFYRCI